MSGGRMEACASRSRIEVPDNRRSLGRALSQELVAVMGRNNHLPLVGGSISAMDRNMGDRTSALN
jgi:hypothetical protein